jgi:hypothetical protein
MKQNPQEKRTRNMSRRRNWHDNKMETGDVGDESKDWIELAQSILMTVNTKINIRVH